MPIIGPDQVISLHTPQGVMVDQFTPQDYSVLDWTRDQNNASTCDITMPPQLDHARIAELAPWFHWVTVWDGHDSSVLWTGPIQKITGSLTQFVINAKDHASYLTRTRSPMSKRWDNFDPAIIAGELWERMIDLHGLRVKPVVRADPYGQTYDFQAVRNEKMFDQTISDLVNLGMVWSVVSGVPVLGPLPKQPLATISDKDFVGRDDLQLVRDGSIVFNDIMVRAEGSEVTRGVDYYGQQLQTVKNLDHLSGVTNVMAAARALAAEVGRVRSVLTMPSAAMLHPETALTIDQLMPSAQFIAETQGVRQLMQLTQVQVHRATGQSDVKVTMSRALTYDEVQDIELNTATDDSKPSKSKSSATASR